MTYALMSDKALARAHHHLPLQFGTGLVASGWRASSHTACRSRLNKLLAKVTHCRIEKHEFMRLDVRISPD